MYNTIDSMQVGREGAIVLFRRNNQFCEALNGMGGVSRKSFLQSLDYFVEE